MDHIVRDGNAVEPPGHVQADGLEGGLVVNFVVVQDFGKIRECGVSFADLLHGLFRQPQEKLAVFFRDEIKAQPVFEHHNFGYAGESGV